MIPNNTIPPSIPPGPSIAKAAVIAAAPVSPVVAMVINRTTAGKPTPANFLTISSMRCHSQIFLVIND
ncbi:conserved protein of unknown function [Limnospira indica PCC 8005]|uniref:Uncharacterized protein n=1 Tax=Limnospira indica PCC 8005 TaxID=376219 RepID=A0A9P1KBD1_9CYAN|nr:conserved protein of unknown function [Limnospira indica PCC 8005]